MLPRSPIMAERAWRLWLAGLVCLAFALRTLWALRFAPPLSLFGDDTFFYAAGHQLSRGLGYVTPLSAVGRVASLPTAEHPPLFPFVLGAISKLGVTSVNAQRMVNVFAGTGTVLLVALVTQRVADRRAALIAAGLCALYPAFVGADSSLMSETLFGTLVAAALLAALQAVDDLTLPRMALLGLLLGLATLTRSEGLLLWPLLVIPLTVRRRRLAVRAAGAAALTCALVLIPWMIRNADTLGRPLLSDNQGITVAGSNCASTFYGREVAGFDFGCVAAAVRGLPPRESEAVTSSRAQAAGLRYVRAHLVRAGVVAAARLAAVWGLFAPGRQVVVTGRRTGLQKAGVAMYYVLLVLGVCGAAGLWGPRRRQLLMLAAPLIATSITAVLTYGLVRLRQGAEVSLLVLAACGVVAVGQAGTARRPFGRHSG